MAATVAVVGFQGPPMGRYFWGDAFLPGSLSQDSALAPVIPVLPHQPPLRSVPADLTGKVLLKAPSELPGALGESCGRGSSPEHCLTLQSQAALGGLVVK